MSPMNEDHSVTILLNNLREGKDVPAAQMVIWERFFHRLKTLADRRLGTRLRRVVDGEDVALSALDDFFSKMQQDGAFPELTNRKSLWPLLAKIASYKAINEYKKATTQKRGGGEVRGESVFGSPESIFGERGIECVERELTPEYADELFLGFQELLDELKKNNESFFKVAVLKLKGYSTAEIAKQLGYKNSKTPERIINQIRVIWKCLHGGLAELSVLSRGEVKFRTNLDEEPTIVGRQRGQEPEPFWGGITEVDGKATRRIIVTKNSDIRVSRNHVRIQIMDEDEIHVANASRKLKVFVNSDFLLNQGQSWSTRSGCSLQITDDLFVNVKLH